MGNLVNLTVALAIKKTVFVPTEYEALKNFYQMMIDKQKELIVIKKK